MVSVNRKFILRINILFFCTLFLSGCQIGYILSSAHNQFMMMSTRVPVNKALEASEITPEQRSKLEISQKARLFAFEKLKLKETENYSTYINLKRPYVTWVVHAAYKWEMKNYEWPFPFIGRMPYKGYFKEEEANEEAKKMQAAGYDVYVRGVSAYSTLGYFQDSVLSSMLRYKEHDLVNTIIHEVVHTTIYIKNNADFNEKLAVFIGNKGTEIFYHLLEGPTSATLKIIEDENHDDQLFAGFITKELNDIEEWYREHGAKQDEQARENRLKLVIEHFENDLKPKLKTKNYDRLSKEKFNNARLGLYKTYMSNLDDFERLYQKLDKDLLKFIEVTKALEKSENPEQDLRSL